VGQREEQYSKVDELLLPEKRPSLGADLVRQTTSIRGKEIERKRERLVRPECEAVVVELAAQASDYDEETTTFKNYLGKESDWRC